MRRKLPALLLLIMILAAAICAPALAYTPEDYDAANPSQLTADMLYSQAAVLIDADSGDVLFGKNERDRMNPASTTKIMTLLLGIESIESGVLSMDQEIAIPQAAADIPSDSSMIPVFPGETMTFGDLLKGFIVHSGNDGGNAIAVLVSGSIDSFVARMNQRAAEIGCTDTHFANPHGYTDENHYTTAYDLAKITQTAMRNETFRSIVATTGGTIRVKERGEIKLVSKHMMMLENSKYYYPGCIGVKTGFTSAAGDCYVGAAEKDGATLISVVLKAPVPKEGEAEVRWVDTARMFDYGWTCYDAYTIDQMFDVAGSRIASIAISNASKDDPFGGRLDLDIAQISNTDYLRMVERNNPAALEQAVQDFVNRSYRDITHDMTAPVSKGEIMGNFSYQDPTTGNVVTATLVASRDVAEQINPPTLLDYFPFLRIFGNQIFLVLLAVLALLIVLIIALAISRRAAKQRRRRMIYERRRQEYLRRQQMGEDRRMPSGSAGAHRGGTSHPRSGAGQSARRPAPGNSRDYDRRRPR